MRPFRTSIAGSVRKQFVESLAARPTASVGGFRLSRREMEVLILIGRGLSNKEIAREINSSTSAVKAHTTAVLRALGARNRTEAGWRSHQPVTAGT